MKRWLIRIAVFVVIVGLLAIAAIEWVRRSDLPRRLALDAVRQQFDARVSIETLRVGWLGRTTVEGVTLTEPMSGEVIASLPRVAVHHRTLPGLIVTRSLNLEAVEASGGELHLREDRHGAWNVVRMVEPALAGPRTGDGAAALPRVRIEGIAVSVQRPNDRAVEVGDVDLNLGPASTAGQRRLEARAGKLGEVRGRIDPSAGWGHEFQFALRRLDTLAALWLDAPVAPLELDGRWRGRVAGSGVVGRLEIDRAAGKMLRVSGAVDVEANDRGVALAPSHVRVAGVSDIDGPIVLTSGQIAVRSQRVVANGLTLRGMGGEAEAEGAFDLAERSGELAVRWHGVQWPEVARHRGRITIDWAAGTLGQYAGRMTYWLDGEAGPLPIRADGSAELRYGPAEGLAASFGFDRLQLEHPSAVMTLGGLRGRLTIDRNAAVLTDLELADGPGIQGEARFGFDEGQWSATLAATSLPVEEPRLPPIAFELAASGAGERVAVERLYAEGVGMTAEIGGDYDPGREQALVMQVRLGREAGMVVEQGGTSFGVSEVSFAGNVTGSLAPLDLELTGKARGASLRLGAHQREALEIPISGRLADGQLHVSGEPVQLLDGSWSIEGDWQIEQGTLGAALEMSDVSLQRLDDLAGRPLALSGIVAGAFELTMPVFDPARLKLTGVWRVAEPGWQGFRSDVSTGRMHLLDDGLSLDDVEVRRGEGVVRGGVRIDLRRQQAKVAFEGRGWPLEHEHLPITGALDASGEVAIDLETLRMDGPIGLGGTVDLGDERVAEVELSGRMAGRRIVLDRVEGAVLGGKLAGEGVADLDQPLNSDLLMISEGLSLSRLKQFVPELGELEGKVDLTFELAHTTDPRAPAPMKGMLALKGHDAAWRELTLLAGEAETYLVPADGAARGQRWADRLLLKRSAWQFGQGALDVWGRLTWRDEGWFYYLQTEMRSLDIGAIGQSLAPETPPLAGKLSGAMMLTGPLDEPSRRHGRAQLKLSEADLANEGLIAGIYNLFNLDMGRKPTGKGEATLALNGNRVIVRRARYRNRGVEMYFGGGLEDLTKGREAGVNGYAIAVAQVLPDLPVMAQIGEALGAVQNYVNAVRFDGTLAEPNVRWVPIEQLGSAARSLVPER